MFRLKEVLKEKKMTAKELAIRAGVTEAVLSRYINGTSSPRLDFMERLAQLLDIDVVELIKAPDEAARSRQYKTKEQRQLDTFHKLLSYCKYCHGVISLPIDKRNDEDFLKMEKIEADICYDEFIYRYDVGGNSLRKEFYRRVADAFSRDKKNYVKYMNLYFGDRPKLLKEMFDLFGYPEEEEKKSPAPGWRM